jgi:hypothetical protein
LAKAKQGAGEPGSLSSLRQNCSVAKAEASTNSFPPGGTRCQNRPQKGKRIKNCRFKGDATLEKRVQRGAARIAYFVSGA